MIQPQKYLQKVSSFFIKQGDKTTIEKLLYNFFLNRAKVKKTNLQRILHRCNIKTTPFLKLKIRRRGKRYKYRVNYLEQEFGDKKSVRILGQTTKNALKTSPRQFSTILEKELNLWYTGKHPLLKKRLEVHIIARKQAPFRWFFSKKKLEKKNLVQKKTNKKYKKKVNSYRNYIAIKKIIV